MILSSLCLNSVLLEGGDIDRWVLCWIRASHSRTLSNHCAVSYRNGQMAVTTVLSCKCGWELESWAEPPASSSKEGLSPLPNSGSLLIGTAVKSSFYFVICSTLPVALRQPRLITEGRRPSQVFWIRSRFYLNFAPAILHEACDFFTRLTPFSALSSVACLLLPWVDRH